MPSDDLGERWQDPNNRQVYKKVFRVTSCLSVTMLIPANLVFGADECRKFPVQILEGSPEEYDPWLTGHRPKAVCMHYNRMLSIWRQKIYLNQASWAGTFFKGFHGWLSLSRWFFNSFFFSHSIFAALDLAVGL